MGGGYSVPGLVFGQLFKARSFTATYTGPTIPKTLDLSNKCYIVTGASSGIGKQLTKELGLRGATIYLLSRNMDKLNAAKEDIINQIKEELNSEDVKCTLKCHAVDLSEITQVQKFVIDIRQEIGDQGKISGLINNAGILPTRRVMDSQEKLEQTIACHVVAPYVLSKGLHSQLKQGEGRVVQNVSAGLYTASLNIDAILNGFASYANKKDNTVDGALVYAIAKRAMLETGDILAKDFADSSNSSNNNKDSDHDNSNKYNVPVFSTHPGWTETPGLKPLMDQHPSYSSISFRSVEDGTKGLLYVALSQSLTSKDSGSFYFDGSKVNKHQPLARTQSSVEDIEKLHDFLDTFVV